MLELVGQAPGLHVGRIPILRERRGRYIDRNRRNGMEILTSDLSERFVPWGLELDSDTNCCRSCLFGISPYLETRQMLMLSVVDNNLLDPSAPPVLCL